MRSSESPSRYLVGIDLGTTNSALAYIDTESRDRKPRILPIPQRSSAETVEALDTLPSFHYEPFEGEFGATNKSGGTQDGVATETAGIAEPYFVGAFARDHGTRLPGRLVVSAKSWLSHSGVDRGAALLPWQSTETVRKISPVEAAARYLKALRIAWDQAFSEYPLKDQDLVLTLPASFDEVARELTVKAAKTAGLPRVVLLEEPQAAFYAWMAAKEAQEDVSSEKSQRNILDDNGLPLMEELEAGRKILVCDIGGGTTDLTLIRTRRDDGGRLRFHRVAVGEHLILGGDNLDLALAHHLERRFTEQGAKLKPAQWNTLVRLCTRVKERILGDNGDPDERFPLVLPGSGSKLLGGGLSIEVSRKEVEEVLVEGFFPRVSLTAKPQRRRSGFQEFGLPFTPDAAVTRYLTDFLQTHRESGAEPGETVRAVPDAVLFNGGLFESKLLKERLVEQLHIWGIEENRKNNTKEANGGADCPTPADNRPKLTVLENRRLDLAVALGAAHYAWVRRGFANRIDASLARTYYIRIDTGNVERDEIIYVDDAKLRNRTNREEQETLLTLLPANAEPDREIELPHDFELLVDEPVTFPIYVSSVRLVDPPGLILPLDEEQMRSLPVIRTVLKTRRKKKEKTRVRLVGKLSEIGTLELRLHEIEGSRPLSWRLEFDVRGATQTDRPDLGSTLGGGASPARVLTGKPLPDVRGVVDETLWETLRSILETTFGPQGTEKPQTLSRRLAQVVSTSQSDGENLMSLDDLPSTLLRRLGEQLVEWEAARKRSEAHESRFLNLLGYAYRPGFGLAMDDWRVETVWRLLHGSIVFPTVQVRMQRWILWRRIAAGLNAGQQKTLAEPILGNLRQLHNQMIVGRGRGSDLDLCNQEGAEIWRLLGGLEELPGEMKQEIGRILLDLLPKKRMVKVYEAMFWTLGRLGARIPFAGPLSSVLPSAIAEEWASRIQKEVSERLAESKVAQWALVELARRCDDRYRDVPSALRDRLAALLRRFPDTERFCEHLLHPVPADTAEQRLQFGESLPVGLSLSRTLPDGISKPVEISRCKEHGRPESQGVEGRRYGKTQM